MHSSFEIFRKNYLIKPKVDKKKDQERKRRHSRSNNKVIYSFRLRGEDKKESFPFNSYGVSD